MTSTLGSLIQDRSQRKPAVAAGKVSSHWKLLKALINTDGDEKEQNVKGVEERFPKIISHGIHHAGQINTRNSSGKRLNFVFNSPLSNDYATICDEGMITVFSLNGKTKKIKSDERFKGIIYATNKTRQCVCWGDSDKLKLMNESFKPISTSQSVAVIHCAVYNKSTHEIITAGVGNITCWSFRYGGKYLMPRKVITERLENCVVSGICLEDSLSKSQRCFVSTGSSIASFNILEGKCLTFLKNRHARQITTMVFFNPRKYLVTAAKDGSIKVWNDDGGLEIAFVGHHGCVNALAIYPFGQFIMSASSDMTLRVWSLEGKDEVDKMQCEYPVEGIGAVVGNDNLYSFTSEGIDLWKIKHIHTLCTMIGCKIKSTKQTTHPKVPLRIVCICGDAAVRIVSGKTGEVLTTALVPDLTSITDAVYSPGDGLLFTLLINGKILKSSTLTNPCTLIEVWESKENVHGLKSPCTCLCLYEYIVEDVMGGDSWKNLVNAATAQRKASNFHQSSSPQSESNGRTLLLGGCVNGRIVVFDWQSKKNSGKVTFEIEAHRDEIVNMTSNPKIDQVVSSGLDNIIKIWRLFPFAEEALAPLMTLYFDELPRHLCVSHHRLLVALYERSRANYAVTVYKTTHKERYDHTTEDDHSDEVIGVASCPKMRLLATASLDGSVRIWDESSRLRRIIKLNATPSSLCFSSERGDLIVAIGDSLHKIKYASYMPQSYVYRMVGMDFKDFEKDSAIPIDEIVFKTLSSVDKQRLTKARSFFFKLTHATDTLPEEESVEKQQEATRRAVALEKIQERESDLKKLRDGEVRSSRKKPKMDGELQNEVFEKYLSLFYKRTSVTVPADSDDERETPVHKEKDVYVPECQPTGFFSIDPQSQWKSKTEMSNNEMDSGEETITEDRMETDIPSRLRSKSLPILNEPSQNQYLEFQGAKAVLEDTSVELTGERTITPPHSSNMGNQSKAKRGNRHESKRKCKHCLRKGIVVGKSSDGYPFSTKPLQEISRESAELALVEDENGDQYEALVIAPDGYIPNSVVAALFADMRAKEQVIEQESKPEEVIPWKPPQLTEAQLEEIRAEQSEPVVTPASSKDSITLKLNKINYDSQLQLALRDTPSPELQYDGLESPPYLDEPIEETPKPKPKPKIQEILKPEDFTVKQIFKPLEKIKNPLPAARPKDEHIPLISPIPTKKPATPVVVPVTPRPPASNQAPLPHFIVQFKGMRWFDKIFPNANPLTFPKPWTVSAFVELLLVFLCKTTDYGTKQHISAAIMVLYGQEAFDNYCLNNVLKTFVSELNISSGSPATWHSDEKKFVRTALQLLTTLRKYTTDVVSEFMSQFILGDEEIRYFVVEIFSEIGVEDASRYFLRELDDFDTWGVTENTMKTHVHNLCLAWLDKWLTQFKEHIRSLAGKIHRARSGQVIRGTKNQKTPSQMKGILKSKESKSNNKQIGVSWNFNTMGDAAAENASSVDAINYFSEMQLQSDIERARTKKHSVKKTSAEDEKTRNTVLILPSINTKPNLARLGETHCSHCHPERETALSVGLLLPPINQHKKSVFIPHIALRLNTLTLNPFPEESDAEIYEAYKYHELLTLRTSQKYFFPSRSYVHTDNVK